MTDLPHPPSDQREPYAGFGGRVGRTFAGSESWWPPSPTPPPDAPNVVVILADDLGFSDLGCYGSEIPTPHLDALAAEGVRSRNHHATPMCSPTRASLLTGLNPHLAGVGHIAHSDAGFPGYAMELAEDAPTMAEIFRDNGWFTCMVGKWHLTKDSHCSDVGPFGSWPVARGFDRYYGILDAFTNLHHPHRLVEDNAAVQVDRYPDGYYFTDDITDRAIAMIRAAKASNPARPFLCYFAHASAHAPLHAKAEDIARHRGRYDGGWDELRDERFARMRAMGVLPADVRLPPRNTEPGHDVRPWDELSEGERRLAARYMEVYAAMVESIDHSFGRLRSALADMGELDNTIVVFMSDNGASREGEVEGTTGYYVHLLGATDVDADLARIDTIGGPTSIPHYPRGWAMACGTPFRLYKINTHAGGHQVPMIVRAPERFGVAGPGSWRDQYTYVTDVLPTLLELAGLEPPTERQGRPVKVMTGCTFAPMLRDPDAPSGHVEQYSEMAGHRGYYRDGWEIVTLHRPLTDFGDHEWELYDLTTDPTETTDLAAEHPDRVAELAAAWEAAAWANQVYPLDEGSQVRFLTRPPEDEVFGRPVRLAPGTPTLERRRSLQLILIRSFTVVVRVHVGAGDEGVLVAHGDQGGGYVVCLDGDGLHAAHNDGQGHLRTIDAGAVASGDREITVAFGAPGRGTWDVAVSVDGDEVGSVRGPDGWPCLFPMAPFEGIDVGLDRRSPVSWPLYERHGPYPFTGTIRDVTYTPGPPAPDAPANLIESLREMGRRFE